MSQADIELSEIRSISRYLYYNILFYPPKYDNVEYWIFKASFHKNQFKKETLLNYFANANAEFVRQFLAEEIPERESMTPDQFELVDILLEI